MRSGLIWLLCLTCALSTPLSSWALAAAPVAEPEQPSAMHHDCNGAGGHELPQAERMDHHLCTADCLCCQGAFSSPALLVTPAAQQVLRPERGLTSASLLPGFLATDPPEKPPKIS